MKVCKYCTSVGGTHHTWCTRPRLAAVNDPEGRALVQAIHDRNAATT
ncbi:hypothetical protein [Pseudarthrobacter sp. LT1]|nr:hypothetical protein [Pseudarthrobacter sp. LT1]WRT14691.1 hypothetical protein VIK36_04130 [Pseudarthrobacter sp. LT1]